MQVSFPFLERTESFDPGTKVSEALEAVGHPLDLVCGGKGTCGKCKIDVVENGETRCVLGCQHDISKGMRILVKNEGRTHQILESTTGQNFNFEPHVRCVRLDHSRCVTPLGGYDFSVLAKAVFEETGLELATPDYKTLHALSTCYRLDGYAYLNVVCSGNRLVDVFPSQDAASVHGIAVDIGTTSVVLFLYDLCTGELIGYRSGINGQHAYGADVVSRIEHASASAENRTAEQAAISQTINALIDEVCQAHAIDPDTIYEAVYCGNSTMQHLFLGVSPLALGKVPFAGLISQAVRIDARDMDIHINESGSHVFMPLLGGYVGADTLACLLEFPDDDNVRMLIDLGTNCEITLGTNSSFLVASTACGPALEGAGISMGMRATRGAIEHVDFDENTGNFKVETIDDAPAEGFCGSGILDMVALLIRLGVIEPKGSFVSGTALEECPFKDRIRKTDGAGRRFVLIEAEDNPRGIEVSMSTKDIRAIQLATSAIRTGWTLLAKAYGIDLKDVFEIKLAGAFGNYINIPNAQYIGMLPEAVGVPLSSMGNGAGLGAQRYLLSESERVRGDAMRTCATHVELANDPDFSATYLANMSFCCKG